MYLPFPMASLHLSGPAFNSFPSRLKRAVHVGTIDHLFDDANGLEDPLKAAILGKKSYGVSQRFGSERRTKESDGIVFPSVRHRNGIRVAAFWPNLVSIPV